MPRNLALLILLLMAGTISAQQPPPLPPMPSIAMPQPKHAPTRKKETYTAICSHCALKQSGLIASLIVTNGSIATNGGVIIQRTLTLSCHNFDCREPFQAQNTAFMIQSIAVEDPPEAEPKSGAGGGGASVVPTWTTNANLKLFARLINRTNVIINPTNAIALTGLIPNSVISNTVTLGIGPVPMMEIRFPTEVGKGYKCQASPDAKKTWRDGVVIVGTGHYVTNYDMPVNLTMIYRVLEVNL